MPDWVWAWVLPVIIGVLLVFGWPLLETWRQGNLEREAKADRTAPDLEYRDLSHMVRHIREDINLLCLIAFFILVAVVTFIIHKW